MVLEYLRSATVRFRHLHLRGNQLTTLDMGNLQVGRGVFQKSPYTPFFKTQKFKTPSLQAFKQLELIDLGENRFQRAPSFKELSRLVDVRLDRNQITRIDTLTFSANPRLRVVHLQGNRIAAVSRNSFDALDSLTTLQLGDNALPHLERSMFDGLRNLKRLYLRNNSISELANTSFASVPGVVVLDLSANRLRSVASGTFAHLGKLHLLDLSDNELEGFESGSFEARVAQIFLEGNRLRCDGEFDWFVEFLVR